MGQRRLRAAIVALALALAGLAAMPGCAGGLFAGEWGKSADYVGFDPNTRNRGGAADFTVIVPLSGIFYDRIRNRRFNSKAAYDDPGLREYFRSEEAFADYYAAFAEALERAHFESHRPTSVWLERMERSGGNGVIVRVGFRGANGLPLRWWSTRIVREDRWEYAGGRWWIIPGKV
jgi:hypothetical protein